MTDDAEVPVADLRTMFDAWLGVGIMWMENGVLYCRKDDGTMFRLPKVVGIEGAQPAGE